MFSILTKWRNQNSQYWKQAHKKSHSLNALILSFDHKPYSGLKKKINIVGYFWQTNIQNIGKSISKIYTNRPDCLTCNKSNLFSLWNVLNCGILKWNMVREIRHSLPDWSWPANMPPIITKSAPAPRRNKQIQIEHVTPTPLGKPKEPHPTPSKKDCRC